MPVEGIKKRQDVDDIEEATLAVPPQHGDAKKTEEVLVDEVFGQQDSNGPNYVNVKWQATSILMMKTQIGLGVLGIPSVLNTLGMVPGVIIILVIGAMCSWSCYIVGKFKLRHKAVHSIADVGHMFFGPVGRELFGAMYWLYMVCIAGSGMLSVSIALNAVSVHGACTVVFVVAAAIIVFLFSCIQTLERISWLGWVGLVTIMTSIITLAIAVGVSRPDLAPPTGPWDKDLNIFGNPSFAEASTAMATVVFAFGGVPSYFSVVAEMRDPRHFTKAVVASQSFVTAVYTVLGIVIYYYCGQYVASPALGSAGPLLKKICYGIAIPALLVGSILYTHLPAKYIFIRLLRGSRHLSKNTATHWVIWISSVGSCVLIAFIIASAIPIFGDLIGLVGALFGTTMSITTMGGMWLYDHWERRHEDKSLRYRLLVLWNVFMIIGGLFLMVGGTYGSVVAIHNDYKVGSVTQPFTCADNSNST